jgi:hemolysin activation/secretion protein
LTDMARHDLPTVLSLYPNASNPIGTLSFSVRQPLFRSPRSEFAIGVGLDLRRSQTFLLDDIPFSFSEGPQDGQSKVTALRFFQDWVQRRPNQVLAARSQFSLGLNAFGATVNERDPDGQFFSWLGQFQ